MPKPRAGVRRPGAFGAIGTGSYTSRPTIKEEPTYTVLNGGKLTVAAKDVIDLIADYDAVLATGHMSGEEIQALVDYAIGKGHKRIIVTHPRDAMPQPVDRYPDRPAKEGA